MREYLVDVISEGIAIGNALVIHNKEDDNENENINIPKEINAFNKAIKRSIEQLTHLNKTDLHIDENFIEVHKMLLEDKKLSDEVINKIKEFYTARKAFSLIMDVYINEIKDARSAYLKDRYFDFMDIKMRVLKNMSNQINDYKNRKNIILVVDELLPSLLVDVKDNLEGVITKKGGYTSHGAILCKSWEIPYVVLPNVDFKNGESIVIDTRKKMAIVDPTDTTILEYEYIRMNRELETPHIHIEHNGLKMMANVSSNKEIKKVISHKFDAIGLYRTEFIFMNYDRPLSEEEQYEIYHEAVSLMQDRFICFRTFDIGDDKQFDYIQLNKKGFTNYTQNPSLFESQVRALIRANDYGNMRIMFPMIETIEEFKFLKNWVLRLKKELNNTKDLKIGMMLETKEALEHLEEFDEADFYSVGTNDLTCQLYHVLRDEIQNYQFYIEDLYAKLKDVIKLCEKKDKCLSICGELASIAPVTKELLTIGVKNFSVSVSSIKNLEFAIKEYYKNEK